MTDEIQDNKEGSDGWIFEDYRGWLLRFAVLAKIPVTDCVTCGIYGWNADIYQMPLNANICICTGDRPFGNVHPDSQVIDRYNKQAKNCHTNEELMELLKQFVEEVKDGKK